MPTSTIIASINEVANQLLAINTNLISLKMMAGQRSFYDSSVFAAIIGATSAAIIYLITWWVERPRIRVDARVGSMIVKKGVAIPTLAVEVVNEGNRHVTLKRFFLKFKDQSAFDFVGPYGLVEDASKLPVKLEGKSSHSIDVIAGHFARTIHEKNEYPTAICFVDALGKVHEKKTPAKFWKNLFGEK